jgi:hypothetical protein
MGSLDDIVKIVSIARLHWMLLGCRRGGTLALIGVLYLESFISEAFYYERDYTLSPRRPDLIMGTSISSCIHDYRSARIPVTLHRVALIL